MFANIVLADEINRASPKTQSALLEVMEERQVTVDGVGHPVGAPFMVIATQNPIEQAGTYRLPEAQLDRFLMKTSVGYPDHEATVRDPERLAAPAPRSSCRPIITAGGRRRDGDQARAGSTSTPRSAATSRGWCEASRTADEVTLGVSVRGALALLRTREDAGRVASGRYYVVPDDVKALAEPVLAHRLSSTRRPSTAGSPPPPW